MDRNDLETQIAIMKKSSVLGYLELIDAYENADLIKADTYEEPLDYLDGYIEGMNHALDIIDDGIPLEEFGINNEDIYEALSKSKEIINYLEINID